MALGQHRGHLKTIEELLHVQRESSPTRCAHCRRDRDDHDHDHEREVAEQALRARIRELEARVAKVEAWLRRLS